MNNLNRKFLDSNKDKLNNISVGSLSKHPEKLIQFGEGNFLRAFVDWQINSLNSAGHFNGSIVVVQPIENGLVDLLNKQEGVYTSLQRGYQDGNLVERAEIITAISRGINPYNNWKEYLELAKNEEIKYIVSNTTEAGIAYLPIPFDQNKCPQSFPAKLTLLLFERFSICSGKAESGFTIIPCELVEKNGEQLKKCVLQHSEDWNLGEEFVQWINESNYFCNTLVDRIVPGFPKDEISLLETKLGYKDELLVSSEVFHLWVIEGNDKLQKELPFTDIGLNVVWTQDLQPYRTLKVRILNGLHTTFTIPSLLIGNETVKQSMDDSLINKMVSKSLHDEIVPTLDFAPEEIEKYASAVLERFRNPFIKHFLISITLNSVSKFKVRVLPSILKYYEQNKKLPVVTLFSLAALLRFYTCKQEEEKKLVCDYNGKKFTLNDEPAVMDFFKSLAEKNLSPKEYVKSVLTNESLWSKDLTKMQGFAEKITKYYEMIDELSFDIALQKILEK